MSQCWQSGLQSWTGSNPSWGFLWFSHPSRQILESNTSKRDMTASLHVLPINHPKKFIHLLPLMKKKKKKKKTPKQLCWINQQITIKPPVTILYFLHMTQKVKKNKQHVKQSGGRNMSMDVKWCCNTTLGSMCGNCLIQNGSVTAINRNWKL